MVRSFRLYFSIECWSLVTVWFSSRIKWFKRLFISWDELVFVAVKIQCWFKFYARLKFLYSQIWLMKDVVETKKN